MKEEAFLGYSINFNDICLIYPPKVKDIVGFGYRKFVVVSSLLTQTQEDIDDQLEQAKLDKIPTPLEFLFFQIAYFPGMRETIGSVFRLFLKEEVQFILNSCQIVIGEYVDKRVIDESNFFAFQNVIRASMGMQPEEPPNENENPKIRRFKMLQRKRDRVKAKQGKNSASELSTLLTSVCCMGIGLNPINIQEITYASLKMLVSRYTEKDSYEIQTASLLAGADPKGKEQQYWIRDLTN